MGSEWAAIIGATVSALAVGYTGWQAYRSKTAETEVQHSIANRPDWPAFTKALSDRVTGQDTKINELFGLVTELRRELDTEQRGSAQLRLEHTSIVDYLRRFLVWSLPLLPPGESPPSPPSELSEDLRDILKGGTK